MKQMIVVFLTAMIAITAVFAGIFGWPSDGGGNGNGKIPDPGGYFSYETVIVTMTAAASGTGRVFTPADFLPEVELSEVSVLIITNRTMLLLTLENPGRENVLRAVYALNGRSDVYRASLSVFYEDTD